MACQKRPEEDCILGGLHHHAGVPIIVSLVFGKIWISCDALFFLRKKADEFSKCVFSQLHLPIIVKGAVHAPKAPGYNHLAIA